MNMSKLKDLTADDFLEKIGLQRLQPGGQWIVPAVTMLGVGILIGAGLGFMLAPKSGRELRGDLRARLHRKAPDDSDLDALVVRAKQQPKADGA